MELFTQKVEIDLNTYIEFVRNSDKLKQILSIIFDNTTLSAKGNSLVIDETQLMNYLKIVEKDKYDDTVEQLKKIQNGGN